MFSMVDKLYSSRTREGHAILSETRWPAPSLCGGSVDSRAVFLTAKFFFETRPGTVHVLCEHFRGSTNQHAIPNRITSAKTKEILLMWCTTIWRTGKQGVAHLQAFLAAVGVGSDVADLIQVGALFHRISTIEKSS